jgi:hypothetical protein
MTDFPLDHVLRPQPPWRTGHTTECGLRADSYPALTRDEFKAKVRRQGQQRAALTTCMTCLHTAQRWPTWDEDPVQAMGRETYGGRRGDTRFRDELVAIAALIAAHRDEFDALLKDLDDIPRLADARARSRARRAPVPRRHR